VERKKTVLTGEGKMNCFDKKKDRSCGEKKSVGEAGAVFEIAGADPLEGRKGVLRKKLARGRCVTKKREDVE